MEDLKTLAKLVKLCRKLGVKSYKSENIEIVLTDDDYTRKPSEKRHANKLMDDEVVKSDAPSEEQLLFWSASSEPEINTQTGEIQ